MIIKILPKYRVSDSNEKVLNKFQEISEEKTERYKEKIKNKSFAIKVIDTYIDAKTKIRHQCLICDHIWLSSPNNILSGHGCPNCKKNKLSAQKRLSHDRYLEMLKDRNISVVPLEKCEGYHKKILHRYSCGHENMVSPASILNCSGCMKCYNSIRGIGLRKTHDDFLREIQKVNASVKVVGTYVNSYTKIECECLSCGNRWYSVPQNLLRGRGCPECAKTVRANARRKKHNAYVDELKEKNPSVTVLEEYIDANIPILHRCNLHNIEWKASPSNILSGNGCVKCRSEKISKKLTLTNEEYILRLSSANPDLEALENYKTSKDKILHRFKSCNHELLIAPSEALHGHGCAICNTGGKEPLSQEEFELKVQKNNSNIKVIGKYEGAIVPVNCKCSICGYQWSPIAGALIRTRNSGCPKCAARANGDSRRKPLELYREEIKAINPYISVTASEYVNSSEKIEHKCLICGWIWNVSPSNALRGSGCPKCSLSHGEREIMKYLDSRNILYESQKKYSDLVGIGGGMLSYDFYLPEYNLLIEFQGEQHENPHGGIFGGIERFRIQKEHDKRKKCYAQTNGINFFEIWYYDQKNIEQLLSYKLNNLKSECVTTAG